jgi:glycosyltransferase involved in cell wall biosynthesis
MSSNNIIGIDLIPTQPIDIHKYRGGGEYAKTLFYEIANNAKGENIVCIFDPKKVLLPDIKQICEVNNFRLVKLDNYSNIEKVLLENGVTKFYSALPDINKFANNKISCMYTIHGLRVLEMPTDKYEYLFTNKLKDYARYVFKQLFTRKYIEIQKAKIKNFMIGSGNNTIIVPSKHTKYSILENYPEIKSQDIKVLYSPRNEVKPNLKVDIKSEFNVTSKKYILLILGSRWIKNNYRAVKALDEIYSQNPNIELQTLVLGVDEKRNVYKGLKNKNKFVFKGYVDADILERLYKEAYLFVFPTLNEGFGYPPLEAMKYGTPVIASAISSVSEVCGDAVLYFNPYSINEIKCRVLQIINDEETRVELKEKGNARFEEINRKQKSMLDQLVNSILD